jgi:hypothetical protein
LAIVFHASVSIGFLPAWFTWSKIHTWIWSQSPEILTSSLDLTQLSRFYLKMETESSLRNVVFWKTNRKTFYKDKTTDNVQKRNIRTKIYTYSSREAGIAQSV